MHLQVLYPFGMSTLHPAFEQAWTRLIRAERGLVEAIEAELRAGDFPPLAWYDVLLELWRRPNHRLRQSELQSELLFAQYNLSRLVDRLEGAGLVRRESCPQDARSRWVVATPGGPRPARDDVAGLCGRDRAACRVETERGGGGRPCGAAWKVVRPLAPDPGRVQTFRTGSCDKTET